MSRGHLDQLKIVIEEHNYLYLKFVGHLKPKMHYLLHYERIIRLFGPVILFSTMRYESKHRELKHVLVDISGSKNLVKSLAISQRFSISTACSKNDSSETKFGPSIKRTQTVNIPQNYLQLKPSILKWLEVHGIKYSVGTVIVLEFPENDLPKFGIIRYIFVLKERIMFSMQPLDTLSFHEHRYAYIVSKENFQGNYMVHRDLLPHPFPCAFFESDTFDMVVSRHML